MKNKNIAMFNLNQTHRDPRVKRVASTLTEEGYNVTVYEMRQGEQEPSEDIDNFKVVRIEIPVSYTSKDMAQIEDACPEAASIVRKCNPVVMNGPPENRFADLKRRAVRKLRSVGRRSFRFPESIPYEAKEFDPVSEVLSIRSIMLVNLQLYLASVGTNPSIIYCNDLDSLLTGFMLKRRFGAKLIYDAHEIYPEQLAEHMRSDIWHEYYTALEKELLPHTDARLTVCDSIGEYFQKEYRSGPVFTLKNVPSIKYLPSESILRRNNDSVRVLYHGAYFPYRGLDQIIDAASDVDATFVFRGIGGYETELKRQVEEKKLEHKVIFEAPVGVAELVSSACENDVGLNPFISVCRNTEFALPNKFFEYMMAGLSLASADLVEMRNLTTKLQNGTLFDPLARDGIVGSLTDLIDDKTHLKECRERSYRAAKDEFHWEHERQQFLAFFNQHIS